MKNVAENAEISCFNTMAEREGFEPSIRVNAYTISSRAPSTTRPPLHNFCIILCVATLHSWNKEQKLYSVEY